MSVSTRLLSAIGGDRYFGNPRDRREVLLGYLLILPTIVLIGAVIIYPLGYNIYLSFTEVPLNPNKSPEWIGLENYISLLSGGRFLGAVGTTIIYTVGSTIISTIIGLGIALLFDRKFRGRRFIRGLILLPHITPIIALAFVWQFMLSPLWGIVPDILTNLGLYTADVGLLAKSGTALPVVILFSAWRNVPFAFLLIVARLQAIPESMYEAAQIDGAGVIAQFKDITLPELKGVIAIVIMLRFIWQFNAFTPVWLLTRQVLTLPVFAYQSAFANFDQGLAAAISILLLVVQALLLIGYVTLFGEDNI